ncbi:MAG: FkbM family methyltransferase [Beijerinckiaceae bacterium]
MAASPLPAPPQPKRIYSPEVEAFYVLSTDRALWRRRKQGTEVGAVIDVGASNGMWSAVCEKHFPDAKYLLIEAQELHRPALENYCRSRPGAEFVIKAAGHAVGQVSFFHEDDPFSGAAHEYEGQGTTWVPMTSVDHEVQNRGLPGPYLLKLDTHGFETQILAGARKTLAAASLVILETYNFRLSDKALRFFEMIDFMRERQFEVIDISEPLWRQNDMALWQFDILFQPSTRPEFAYETYTGNPKGTAFSGTD